MSKKSRRKRLKIKQPQVFLKPPTIQPISKEGYHYLVISLFLLLIITFIVFSPALKNGFTNWDDEKLVVDNTVIRQLSWTNLKTIFTSYFLGTYIPLTMLSFSLEYHFFNLNPSVFHLTNLFLHIFNALLVFWLIFVLSRKVFLSLIASFLFSIHPLRVESVAWVTERKDMLYSFFYLWALICYLYHIKNNSIKSLFLSLFLFILSVLAKGVAITLPFVFLLCDYLLKGRFTRQALIEKIPFFAVSIVFVLIGYFAQMQEKIREGVSFDFLHGVILGSHGIIFYLLKLVFPIKLSALYPYPASGSSSLFPPHFYFSPLIVIMLIAGVIYLGKYSRKIPFGSLFFLFIILPVSELIPLVGEAIAADRYTYLPSIGLAFLAGEGFFWLYENRLRYSRILKIIATFAIISIIAFFSYLTWQRTHIWRDSITLWNDVLKKYPRATLAYNNRGTAYIERGEYDKAMADFEQALTISPFYEEAYNNRGIVFHKKGEYEKALTDFDQALRINPNYAEAFYNRGITYTKMGENAKAIADFIEALRINPDYQAAFHNRGVAYMNIGEYEKAIADFTEALRINPQSAETYTARGSVYDDKREYDKAIADYTQALALNPQYAEAYNNRGVAYFNKREYEKAIAEHTQALSINPNYAEAYNNRGNAYSRMGDYDKAIADFDQALRIKPDFLFAYRNRGVNYLKKGEYDKAITDFSQAINLKPDYADAYYHRAVAYAKKGEYDRARADVHQAQNLGYRIDPRFLIEVEKNSARQRK